jgi:hypothetical protein
MPRAHSPARLASKGSGWLWGLVSRGYADGGHGPSHSILAGTVYFVNYIIATLRVHKLVPQNALTYFNRAVSTVKVQSVTAKRRFDTVEVWGSSPHVPTISLNNLHNPPKNLGTYPGPTSASHPVALAHVLRLGSSPISCAEVRPSEPTQ